MTRPATRGILILLAVVLHGLPWWRPRDTGSTAQFVVPTPIAAASLVPFFQEEWINSNSPEPMSHVASICELPNGRLLAVWYAGSREGAGDVAIFSATQSPGESTWSQPRTIMTRESAAHDLNRAIKKVGNPVIFSDVEGKLRLLFVTITLGGWSGSSLNLATSTDEGWSWSPSQRLTLSPFFNLSELVKNGPVEMSDGNWVVPIYHELAGRFPELLWLRDVAGELTATKSRIVGGHAGFQPALVPLNTNTALAFLRDGGSLKKILIARTDDTGKNWDSPHALDLPNPNSGLAALRLADGRLILVFNDSMTGRDNLRLAVSKDEGRTWTRVATLAEEPGAEFSYPFLIQARDGNVQLVYTWKRKAIKHVVFNAAWLDAQQIPATK